MAFGSITLTNTGAGNTFLVKYSSAGTPLWAQNLGGPGDNYTTSVAVDHAGNCYVGGSFSNVLTVGATTLASAGERDAFLLKFSPNGALLWARHAGGAGHDTGRVGVDGAGNAFLVGRFTGTIQLGPASLSSTGASALFVARYDPAGNLQWARQIESTGPSLFNEGGCVTDDAGNCYVPGAFVGRVNFGSVTVTSRGGLDAFVVSFDGVGRFRWAQTAGGPRDDAALRVAVDGANNCYLAGWFEGASRFGTNRLQAAGSRDLFVAKLPAAPSLTLRRNAGLATLTLWGESGGRYAVEYAPAFPWTNAWLTLTNVTLTHSAQLIPDSLTSPQRFYRLRRLP
jgi:hypothetical protein